MKLAVFPLAQDYRSRKPAVSYCLIEMIDLWSAYVRSLYVSSLLGAARGNKQQITCVQNFATPADTLIYAAHWKFLRSAAGRRGQVPPPYQRTNEPAWHRTNNILNLAADLSLSNEPAIRAAVARSGVALGHMIEVRNYFAHRNDETLTAANAQLYQYAITPAHSLEESVCTQVAGLSVTLLEFWLIELEAAIDIMGR